MALVPVEHHRRVQALRESIRLWDPVAQFGLCGEGEAESGEVGGSGSL
jgi:hypothetical protein